jgi:RND family efflux transporter MFP subunit
MGFLCRAVGTVLLLVASLGHADTNLLTVKSQALTNQFQAYARVEPVAVISVQPIQPGVVTNLDVVPGVLVRAGQKLGGLTGPEMEAALAKAKAEVASAETKIAAVKERLDVARQQLASHLSTQQQIADAESALADATGKLNTAQAQLRAVQLASNLVAPSDGTVLSVNAANGQRVVPGQTILSMQPGGRLWLRASYYGSDIAAIHLGMTGRFSPASGGEVIPVKVATVFGALQPGGAEAVGLVPLHPEAGWLNGEFGAVTLDGEVRSLVAVPTRALILDKGDWWVVVHTPNGDQPRQVVPGPARGWQTFIESGLKSGDQVVVENAYLDFHQDISRSYKPPD